MPVNQQPSKNDGSFPQQGPSKHLKRCVCPTIAYVLAVAAAAQIPTNTSARQVIHNISQASIVYIIIVYNYLRFANEIPAALALNSPGTIAYIIHAYCSYPYPSAFHSHQLV